MCFKMYNLPRIGIRTESWSRLALHPALMTDWCPVAAFGLQNPQKLMSSLVIGHDLTSIKRGTLFLPLSHEDYDSITPCFSHVDLGGSFSPPSQMTYGSISHDAAIAGSRKSTLLKIALLLMMRKSLSWNLKGCILIILTQLVESSAEGLDE